MRASQLFFRTFKQPPADADIASHKLLEQAGYIYRVGRGLYAYSSLMQRVLTKLGSLVREELIAEGAIEVTLPHLHPAELWHETGRWGDYTAERLLYTVEDREGHAFCAAPTHEEAMTAFVRSWVKSYRELPLNLFQIGAKFRDEIRPRFGLIRAKEFLMKDGYSYSSSSEEMELQYEKMRKAYCAIFDRLELDYVLVEAHGGKIGGKGKSQEFQVKTAIGEDVVMLCGSYAANVEATRSIPPPFDYDATPKKVERVDTPNISTIEELAHFLKLQPQEILKTVVFKLIFLDRKEFVAIGIRGDRQVNPLKVQDHFGAVEIEPASDAEINKKSVVGFVGPVDCPFTFYADDSVRPMRNFCCAKNEKDLHLLNVNFDEEPEFHDFLLAEEGDQHPDGGTFTIQRGTEVAHIFNLGTKYSEKMGATFQDEKGEQQPFWMGTYGIGMGRTAQACVEQKHDEKGIVWPKEIAPFQVVIIPAATHNEELTKAAEELYAELLPFDALLDDRDQRLGFKLKDSDLIGIPYKIIVGKSFLESGKIEVESRAGEKELIVRDEIGKWATTHLLG